MNVDLLCAVFCGMFIPLLSLQKRAKKLEAAKRKKENSKNSDTNKAQGTADDIFPATRYRTRKFGHPSQESQHLSFHDSAHFRPGTGIFTAEEIKSRQQEALGDEANDAFVSNWDGDADSDTPMGSAPADTRNGETTAAEAGFVVC